MMLRDVDRNPLINLQRRCLKDWETLKKSTPDPNHLIPFKVYEKIWTAGARTILEKVEKWP